MGTENGTVAYYLSIGDGEMGRWGARAAQIHCVPINYS